MMVIAVGLSSYNVALFHLVNHAFYKGLLFLGAGAVIHAVADNQDFRKYGGLRPFLPLTYSVMLIASLSLVAFPFMTGFYSKDFILESAYGQFYLSSTVVYFIATISAMFTTLYSVKVLYLTFLTNPNGPLVNYKQAHEGDMFMSLPLIALAILSIFFGYITKDIFLGLGSDFFADNSLFIHPSHEIMLDTEFAVPTLFKLIPLGLTILLSIISMVLSEFLPKILIHFKFTRFGYNIFSFFNQRFFIELLYNKFVTGLVLKLGGQTTKVIDKGSVELLGPYGLEKGLVNLSRNIASLDTGVITSYALYILVGLIFYILIPYIYLADNSLLLLILFGLFSTIKNKSLSVPKPHNFINSPLQTGFYLPKGLLSYIKNHLGIAIFISVMIIFLKSPLRFFCSELGIMPFFYIYSGLISCIASQVTLGLKDREFNSFLSITYIFIVTVIITYLSMTCLGIGAMFIFYYFMPVTFELFWNKLITDLQDYSLCHMMPNQGRVNNKNIPISPADPLGQLDRISSVFNRDSTNQPLARNIAEALDLQSEKSGGLLSSNIIPHKVSLFLSEHLRLNDRARYEKIFPENESNSIPQWWNLSNTKGLRDNLRNIP